MTRPILGLRLRLQLAVLALASATACALFSARVGAAQFVVVDVAYTHGPETTTDSHYAVDSPAGTPQNWQSPVNYAGGQAVVQLRVKTKPTNAETKFQICFISKPDYTCTDQSPTYTAPGTITWATPFDSFYVGNGGNVDWSQGADRMTLILKDTKNVKPAPENVGAETAARYMPTDLHVMVTLVPQGEVYVPPVTDPVGGGGSGGGGGASAGGVGGGAGGHGGASSVSGAGGGGAPAVGVMPLPPSGGAPIATGGSAGARAATPVATDNAGCGFAVPRPAPLGTAAFWTLLALASSTARKRRRPAIAPGSATS